MTASDVVLAGNRYAAAVSGSPAQVTAGGSVQVTVNWGAAVPLLDSALWATHAGASTPSGATVRPGRVLPLPDGSAIVAGDLPYSGSPVFGIGEPGQTTLSPGLCPQSGGCKIFLARFNPDGTFAWAKRMGAQQDTFGDARLLADGSIALTGAVDLSNGSTARFGAGEPNDTTFTGTASNAAFVARFAVNDGSLIWVRYATIASSTSFATGADIAPATDGGLAVCGSILGTATLGVGEPNQTALSSTGGGAMVAEFDSAGALRSAVAYSAPSGASIGFSGCGRASDGGLIVTGNVYGSVSFGGATLQATVSAPLTARLGADGSVAWARSAAASAVQIQGSAFATGARLDILPDDSTLQIGSLTYATVVFGAGEPNQTSLSNSRAYAWGYVARYGPDGTLAWAKGLQEATATSLSQGLGGVVVGAAGSDFPTATFGAGEPGQTMVTGHTGAAYIAVLDPQTGALSWVRRSADGTAAESIYAKSVQAAVRPDGSALLAGTINAFATGQSQVVAPDSATPITVVFAYNDLFLAALQ